MTMRYLVALAILMGAGTALGDDGKGEGSAATAPSPAQVYAASQKAEARGDIPAWLATYTHASQDRLCEFTLMGLDYVALGSPGGTAEPATVIAAAKALKAKYAADLKMVGEEGKKSLVVLKDHSRRIAFMVEVYALDEKTKSKSDKARDKAKVARELTDVTIDGDTAVGTAKRPGSEGSMGRQVHFKRVDGKWKMELRFPSGGSADKPETDTPKPDAPKLEGPKPGTPAYVYTEAGKAYARGDLAAWLTAYTRKSQDVFCKNLLDSVEMIAKGKLQGQEAPAWATAEAKALQTTYAAELKTVGEGSKRSMQVLKDNRRRIAFMAGVLALAEKVAPGFLDKDLYSGKVGMIEITGDLAILTVHREGAKSEHVNLSLVGGVWKLRLK